jgi:hypothetical protein
VTSSLAPKNGSGLWLDYEHGHDFDTPPHLPALRRLEYINQLDRRRIQ